MTNTETLACNRLDSAKSEIKQVLKSLDPSPADPLSTELLSILDAMDAARLKITARAARFEDR